MCMFQGGVTYLQKISCVPEAIVALAQLVECPHNSGTDLLLRGWPLRKVAGSNPAATFFLHLFALFFEEISVICFCLSWCGLTSKKFCVWSFHDCRGCGKTLRIMVCTQNRRQI